MCFEIKTLKEKRKSLTKHSHFYFKIRALTGVSPWRRLWHSWVQPAPSAGPHWSRTHWRAPRQCVGPPPACGAFTGQFGRSTHTHMQNVRGFYGSLSTRRKTSPEILDGLGHGGCWSATETVLLAVVSGSGQRTCPCLSENRPRGHQEADPKQSPRPQHPEGAKLLDQRRPQWSTLSVCSPHQPPNDL